jgi:hypothetical protein
MATVARGIRSNNPGNIDFNLRNDWQGQLGMEEGVSIPRFARFDTPESGIRALAKLLINYRGKDGMPGVGLQGIDTVRETINHWAPSVENNTEAYVKAVSVEAGVLPNESIDIRDRRILLGVVTAIIKHENGGSPYSQAVIAEGVRRALS